MKSKLTNIILFVAVAGIWGYIVYFIYQSVSDDDSAPVGYSLSRSNTPQDSVKSEFVLLLDYTDPFLKKESTTTPSNKSVPKKINTKQPELDLEWHKITYNGIIENRTAQSKPLAIIGFEQNIYFASVGQTVAEIQLVSILPDSIKVIWTGKSKWIKKN